MKLFFAEGDFSGSIFRDGLRLRPRSIWVIRVYRLIIKCPCTCFGNLLALSLFGNHALRSYKSVWVEQTPKASFRRLRMETSSHIVASNFGLWWSCCLVMCWPPSGSEFQWMIFCGFEEMTWNDMLQAAWWNWRVPQRDPQHLKVASHTDAILRHCNASGCECQVSPGYRGRKPQTELSLCRAMKPLKPSHWTGISWSSVQTLRWRCRVTLSWLAFQGSTWRNQTDS